jgi:hypothetical protein
MMTHQQKKFGKIILILLVIILLILFLCRESGTSLVYLRSIAPGQTGSQVCHEEGMSCISVATSEVFDNEGRFYGYLTPSCDSQIVESVSCQRDFGATYALDNVEYKKAPHATSTQTLDSDTFCLIEEQKPHRGIYNSAYCVKC